VLDVVGRDFGQGRRSINAQCFRRFAGRLRGRDSRNGLKTKISSGVKPDELVKEMTVPVAMARADREQPIDFVEQIAVARLQQDGTTDALRITRL
jgi:hypothetical protein